MTSSGPTADGLSTDNSRLIGLSDGVFAFALTLLVINLKLPDAVTVARVGLARAVLGQSDTLATWLLSFFVISLFWQASHHFFKLLKGHDARLTWLNFLLLLCISFIWYPTALLGAYGHQQFAVVFYDGALVLTSLAQMSLWVYAVHDPDLLDVSAVGGDYRQAWRRTIGTLATGLLSIIISFVSAHFAELCWLLVPLVRMAASRFGRADSGKPAKPPP